jgi:TRAP-type C4-dicarboxylate transport system substrate-binding protein
MLNLVTLWLIINLKEVIAMKQGLSKKVTYIGLALCVIGLMFAFACPGPTSTPTPTPTQTQTPTPTPTTTPPAEEVLIRITTPVPPGDDMIVWAQEGIDKFNASAKGAYKIQVFPGGQLASMPETLDNIMMGAVEGGIFPPAAFQGTVPEFGLIELPFLFNNHEAIVSAQDDLNALYDDLLQANCNQRGLGCFTPSTRDILSVSKPVKTLEDFKGLVVGCDTPTDAAMIETLGGAGVVVDFTEDYSNLQKGVIDAKTSGPQYMYVAKLYEVANYFTIYHGICAYYMITINSDVYDEMPPEIQDSLMEEMTAIAHTINERYIALYYESEDLLAEMGVQFYHLPPDERDRWKDLLYPGTLARIAEFGEVGERLRQIAEDAGAEHPYTLPEG